MEWANEYQLSGWVIITNGDGGVASGSLQVELQPWSFGLDWGSAAAWRRSTFIIWTGWTLAVALLWWQHHIHSHACCCCCCLSQALLTIFAVTYRRPNEDIVRGRCQCRVEERLPVVDLSTSACLHHNQAISTTSLTASKHRTRKFLCHNCYRWKCNCLHKHTHECSEWVTAERPNWLFLVLGKTG